MANVSYTQTFPASNAEEALHQGSSKIFRWTPLTKATDDVGLPLGKDHARHTDRSVQVYGTFGVGGKVLMEGSLDGAIYATLTDPQGNDLEITSAKIEAISEATPFLRPRVSAGDGDTSLTVLVFVR